MAVAKYEEQKGGGTGGVCGGGRLFLSDVVDDFDRLKSGARHDSVEFHFTTRRL